jgi:GNAT superfamily N-acetyltransferase
VKFTVRRVEGPRWAETLLKVQKQTLPHDDTLDPATGLWWLAWGEDGAVAGFASLHPSKRWLETGLLSRAGVLLHYQGHGLQKKLIRARERFARRLGWGWMISDTTDNPASANSLISCGYRLYEPRWPYRVKETLYWRKRL